MLSFWLTLFLKIFFFSSNNVSNSYLIDLEVLAFLRESKEKDMPLIMKAFSKRLVDASSVASLIPSAVLGCSATSSKGKLLKKRFARSSMPRVPRVSP